MRNIFNILDHILTNINHTTEQIQKPKGQWKLISSAGEPDYFWLYWKLIPSFCYIKCFSKICPTWTSKYSSRPFFVCPNFAVIQQYKKKTLQRFFKHLLNIHLSYWRRLSFTIHAKLNYQLRANWILCVGTIDKSR